MHELDRAIAESATQGFVKVLTPPGKDRILGVTIVGQNAGELLTEYVLAISGQEHNADAAARGETVFGEYCVACHGEGGVGNQELGAPNLTDAIWLYGGDRQTVQNTIYAGRGGVMPAWSGRLDPVTIKQLAVYVHSLGGGE